MSVCLQFVINVVMFSAMVIVTFIVHLMLPATAITIKFLIRILVSHTVSAITTVQRDCHWYGMAFSTAIIISIVFVLPLLLVRKNLMTSIVIDITG